MSGQSERDVERLAEALLDSTGVTSIDTPQGRAFRVALAQRILASDWLTERDAAIRDEAKAEALAPIRALLAKWSGCWCGEQMAPDHDPRVQDCPQHGDGAADHFGSIVRDDLRALLDGGDQL